MSNQAPVIFSPKAVFMDEDTVFQGTVIGFGDFDPDGDPLSVSLVSGPGFGTLELEADGSFTYTPAEDFAGVDTFDYAVSDGQGGVTQGRVAVTVRDVPDDDEQGPTAVADMVEVTENQTVTVDVLDNDVSQFPTTRDIDRIVGITGVGGDISVVNDQIVFDPGTDFDFLQTDETATVEVTYRMLDLFFAFSTAVLTLTVTGVNDAPFVVDPKEMTVDEDSELDSIVFWKPDFDPEGDPLTIDLVQGPDFGTFTFTTAGSFLYIPDPDFFGVDSFVYQVEDGQGGVTVATANITVINTPDAVDDTAVATENGVTRFDVLANDTGADPSLFVLTEVEILEGGGAAVIEGTQLAFYPEADFEALTTGETAQVTLRYVMDDGTGRTDTATVTLTVEGVNDAPQVADKLFATAEENAVSGTVIGEGDRDAEGDALTAAVVSGPQSGQLTLEGDGAFTYTPDPDFFGEDSFVFDVRDGQGGVTTATATLTVTGVNDDPVLDGDRLFTLNEDTVLTGSVFKPGDQDPDGDTLSASLLTGPASGMATVAIDGTLVYTPNPDFFGADRLTVQITDGQGGVATGTVSLTVIDVPEPVFNEVPGTEDKDSLQGTDEDDFLEGFGGRDKLDGGEGNDILDGGDGDDQLDGGAGINDLLGGPGNDRFKIGKDAGANTIRGGEGDDRITIKGGINMVFGDGGDDRINLKKGQSTADGGAGTDDLRAGKDNDVFVFKPGNDRDEIAKFGKKGADRIDLSAYDDLTYEAFVAQLTQDRKDLVWAPNDTDRLVLEKLDLEDVLPEHFIFA